MRLRTSFVAILATLALGAIGVPAAGAATTTGASPQVTKSPALYTVPVNNTGNVGTMSGVAKNGKKFTGHFGIQRFVVKSGKVYALGTLTGRLNGRHVTRGNVMIPVNNLNNGSGAQAAVDCTVLHLVLGPVNLNLLGLKVTLGGGTAANQPIVLDITAQQGGGLLGDLLCGVTNALNQGGILGQLGTQLQNLAATLNSIFSLLGGGL